MTSSSTEQVSPQTLRKVIIAAGIGNFVEWFDFAVYGFLATTIAQCMAKVLATDFLPTTANFFDHGGESLLSPQGATHSPVGGREGFQARATVGIPDVRHGIEPR